MSLSQLFCGVFTFLMILLWKEVFRKQSINYLFFVSFFKTKTWKTFENTSNVLIWRYTLIKANALHKIAVYLNVFFFFGKHFSVQKVEWQQRNDFRKAGRSSQKKKWLLQLVVKIIEKWLWRTLCFSLISRLQVRSVTKNKCFICIFQEFGLNSVQQLYWTAYKRTHIYNALKS